MKIINLKGIILIIMTVNTLSLSAQHNKWLDSISINTDTYLYEAKTIHYFFDGKEYGIRILHYKGGWEHVGSEFYFQWIKYEETGGKIIAQKEFKEAGSRMWSMSLDKVESKYDGVYIEISASHSYDGTERIFKIKIDSIGDYDTMDSEFK